MDDYRAAVVDYLRRVKDESGFSMNELAARVGVSHTTLTRPISNAQYKYVPKFATLQKISLLTGIALPDQLTSAAIGAPDRLQIKALLVRGMVAAGVWQEADTVQDADLGQIPMVEDPAYRGLRQWAELVRGPSMNRVFEDGDYLHVVGFADTGYAPRSGDEVIVERRRNQEGEIERTVKRLVLIDGKFALVGDSTVERWNRPLPLGDLGDDGDIRLVGIVIGSYRPRPRR